MTPEAFQGFVFAICPAKLSKIIKARKHDLNAFSKKLAGTSWGLSQSLSIMCDKPEVANQLLKRDIKDFLNNNGEYLQLLHFSDFYLKPDESPYNQDTPAERLTKAVDNRQHVGPPALSRRVAVVCLASPRAFPGASRQWRRRLPPCRGRACALCCCARVKEPEPGACRRQSASTR